MFSAEIEHYVSYSKSFYGCSLIVQSSQDFVDMPTSVTLGQPGYYVRALVTPAVLGTDEAVRSLPLKQRQCLFPDEQVSELQSRYRHQTCMTECRLRGILQRCRCIPFYFPLHSQYADYIFQINYNILVESSQFHSIQILRHSRSTGNAPYEISSVCATSVVLYRVYDHRTGQSAFQYRMTPDWIANACPSAS